MSEQKIYKPSIYNASTVYNTGAGGGGGGGGYLPEGYKKITYLETDGTSCAEYTLDSIINCGAKQMNINICFATDLNAANLQNFNVFSTFDENNIGNEFSFRLRNDGNIIPYFVSVTSYGLSVNFSPKNTITNFKNTDTQLVTNWGSRSIANVKNQIKKIKVFSVGTYARPMRLLDSFILDASTNKVVFTILPCIEIESGIYGFFDLIGNKFYNATTGTFTGGL